MKTKGKDKIRLPDGQVMTLSEAFDRGMVVPIATAGRGSSQRYFARYTLGDFSWEIGKMLYDSRSSKIEGVKDKDRSSPSPTWHGPFESDRVDVIHLWQGETPWSTSMGEVEFREDETYWWRSMTNSGWTKWKEAESLDDAKSKVEDAGMEQNPTPSQKSAARRLANP